MLNIAEVAVNVDETGWVPPGLLSLGSEETMDKPLGTSTARDESAAVCTDRLADTFCSTDPKVGGTPVISWAYDCPTGTVAGTAGGTAVAIYNRQDCCQDRLSGAVLTAYNADGSVAGKPYKFGTIPNAKPDPADPFVIVMAKSATAAPTTAKPTSAVKPTAKPTPTVKPTSTAAPTSVTQTPRNTTRTAAPVTQTPAVPTGVSQPIPLGSVACPASRSNCTGE